MLTRSSVVALLITLMTNELVLAQGWRDLVPMKSTCKDVKRVLPSATCKLPHETFDLNQERITISFSEYACYKAYEKFWDVPVGTIVGIERYLKKRIPLAEFMKDVSKCEKSYTDFLDQVLYSCAEAGTSFDTINGEVNRIFYVPTAGDKYLQCPSRRQKAPVPKKRGSAKLHASQVIFFLHG